MPDSNPPLPLRRSAIVVRGVVQGVGFRPFIYNAARSRNLAGWVLNEADQVRIEVQGPPDAVAVFLENIQRHPPEQAKIESFEVCDVPCQDGVPAAFEILRSDASALPGPTIPADLATCADCLAEIFSPGERRYGYPFTNCTNCGPRWSIIEQLPYDRPRISMKCFTMCAPCRAEYENPADRRFHAQPIACPACGPHLQLFDAQGASLSSPHAATRDVLNPGPIQQAASAILAGQILGLKGLGGFQLLADATNPAAVARLRERKRRPDRPFALMMRSLEEVQKYCEVSAEEARMLASHQAPIVLLRQLNFISSNAGDEDVPARLQLVLAPNLTPGNPYLGVMLPYTPLHHLLMAAIRRPIVCTSGNLSEEPMVISIEEALHRLGHVADLFLTHDRPIVRPVDDSIVRFGPAGLQVVRRARGFAPLPIHVPNTGNRTILALGGHLKNTIALCLGDERSAKGEAGRGKAEEDRKPGAGNRGREAGDRVGNISADAEYSVLSTQCSVHGALQSSSATNDQRPATNDQRPATNDDLRGRGRPGSPVIVSAHIGDLDSPASVGVFQKAIDDLTQFYQVRPEAVACDLHPDYASTRHAETLAARWDVPLLRVQHHHAHVAACMAEHGLTGPVLGFAWDGTGYGLDGTIWGGEALVCQESNFSRAAHLRTFALPGGDAAARKPRRSALGVLYEIFGEEAAAYAEGWFPPGELKTLLQMLRRGTNCPRTSSLGRLFDAVAAIIRLSPQSGNITFEGQAAMALEFAADAVSAPLPLEEGPGMRAYRLPLVQKEITEKENVPLVADWEPLIRQLLADLSSGQPPSQTSVRFHAALAELALEIANTQKIPQIVLSGGCFQNALLLRLTYSRLTESGYQVFVPQQVPPGDGSIALGQIFVASLKRPIE